MTPTGLILQHSTLLEKMGQAYCSYRNIRSVALSVYGHVITKFSRMGRIPHSLSYGAPPQLGASCAKKGLDGIYHMTREIGDSDVMDST